MAEPALRGPASLHGSSSSGLFFLPQTGASGAGPHLLLPGAQCT